MFYKDIKEETGLPLTVACKTLDVSRSGYLKWVKRNPVRPAAGEQRIIRRVEKISAEFGYYGYRRITKALNRLIPPVNHKKVSRIMKEKGLTIKIRKFRPRTTNSNHSLPLYQDLAKDLTVTRINQLWVADITYIDMNGVFLYLALLEDVYSRKIVGWQLSRNIDAQLCLDALEMAFAVRKGTTLDGLIHHSDHGSQYLSKDYVGRLRAMGIRSSTGEVGVAYDNAFAEALNKSVKYDEVYPSEYLSFEDVYTSIKKYVEVYNKKRLHSSIGYKSPDEFEKGLKKLP